MIPLSILIPSISSRNESASRLYRDLERQIVECGESVQCLMLVNNGTCSVGRIRNDLRAISHGEYIAFVDDDDRVEPDYVASILRAIRESEEKRVDVVTFDVAVTGYAPHGFPDKIARYSLAYDCDSNEGEVYQRLPNHLMAWRRDLARIVAFEEKNHGEDSSWAERMARFAKTEARVDHVLYHYQFGDGSISMRPEAR